MEPKVYTVRPTLGCDPELFIAQDGKVVGSEKAIPDAGLRAGNSAIVQDGVQVELHPSPSTCRESMMYGLAQAFTTLNRQLNTIPNMKASFTSVIEMDPAELDKLSEKSKKLGCAPSFNAYDKNATIAIDGTTYLKRSAGGHLHFGGIMSYGKALGGSIDPDRYANMLDIILGNQSVLMDRDPNAAERRKVYGRAGEYRTPPHGFEYRTLSNFWLRHCALASGVLGLGRQAISVVYCTEGHRTGYDANNGGGAYHWTDFEGELLKLVELEAVRDAINGNDLALAKKNWAKIRPFFERYVYAGDNGLNPNNLDAFERFTDMIEKKGLDHWFPQDPMAHWSQIGDGNRSVYDRGWESFLNRVGSGNWLD